MHKLWSHKKRIRITQEVKAYLEKIAKLVNLIEMLLQKKVNLFWKNLVIEPVVIQG
jgi:hypothetical protein